MVRPSRGEKMFQVYSVPLPGMITSVSWPCRSTAGRSCVMARLWSKRRPALIVSRSLTVIASLAKAEAVSETPPTLAGSVEMDWNGRPRLSTYRVPVGMVPSRLVLAAFDLPTDLPLVIGAQQVGPVVAEGRLGRGAHDRQFTAAGRRPACDARGTVEPAWRRQVARWRLVVLGVDESADPHVPHGIGRRHMCQVAECHRPAPRHAGARSIRTA